MVEPTLLMLALALLVASAGVGLWHWSERERTRARVSAHLDRQLRVDPTEGEGVAPWLRELTDPFEATEPPLQDVPATLRREAGNWLPDWLAGALSVRAIALWALGTALACAAAGLFLGPLAAACAVVACLVGGVFAAWLALQRFRRRLVRQMPGFIDTMVRLITIGNSTHAAFQLSIASVDEPLRLYLDKASSLVRAGTELDEAVSQMAQAVRVEEMHLLAAILGLGVRYGGRADLLLERIANFMRDREQAEQELTALSAETRLSAWILGLLPIGVGMAIVMMNAVYFMRMWNDDTGRMLLYGAGALQLLGAVLLYRLARLS